MPARFLLSSYESRAFLLNSLNLANAAASPASMISTPSGNRKSGKLRYSAVGSTQFIFFGVKVKLDTRLLTRLCAR